MTQKDQEVITQAVAKSGPLPRNFMGNLADEIAQLVIKRLPKPSGKKKPKKKKEQKIDFPMFLDTSAIIDGRIFDILDIGVMQGTLVVPEIILGELKHIADSQDMVKRERGQRGLSLLEKSKKNKLMKFLLLVKDEEISKKQTLVDDQLIALAKKYKGRVVTCDYNLEKKAAISGVIAINVHELANRLKVIAVPGESLHVLMQHQGKDPTQGVGYLEDGTMIVVENAYADTGKAVNVTVSRVISTSSGRILFAKKI